MPAYDAVELITKKRDGGSFTADEVRWLLDAYVHGLVADEQMAALVMAVYFNGFDRSELDAWTSAMIACWTSRPAMKSDGMVARSTPPVSRMSVAGS